MSINLKIFLIIVEIFFFVTVLVNIRKKRLLLKYSLLWLGAAFLMLIVIIFPQVLEFLCCLLGIE